MVLIYYANWANNDVELPPTTSSTGEIRSVDKIYNNIIETDFGTASFGSNTNALIIKNIPLTSINEIQAIVLYNRTSTITNTNRVLGLFFELYNSTNDPDLTEVLATTNVITSDVNTYRFDFPSLSTYTAFVGEDSITNILNNTFALAEDAIFTDYAFEITGDVVASGSITSNGVNINTTLADILSRLELLENP
jgi:hypothetical protein